MTARFDSLDAVPAGKLRDAIAKQVGIDDARTRKKARPPEPAPRRERRVTTEPLRLEVPCRPWSINEERTIHWSERSKRVHAVRVAAAALVPRDAGRYEVPVEIEATTRGHRFDALNDLGAIKGCVDALRDSGILQDDTARWVRRYIMNAPVPDAPPGLTLIVRVANSATDSGTDHRRTSH